jgi:TnpA family transposase
LIGTATVDHDDLLFARESLETANGPYDMRFFVQRGNDDADAHIILKANRLYFRNYHAQVIAANARDATYVLDGLLYHESDLRIEEHYTDTAGFTDHVFALCHLLGFRFAPRIRDLADKRLYVPGSDREYASLAPLVGGRLHLKLVTPQW